MTVATVQDVVAFVRIIDPKDRSLERIRYVKIAVAIEGKSVRRWNVIAEYDRVLAPVWVIDVSIGWRSYAWNRSNVLDRCRDFEIGGYTLNLRRFSHERADVAM